MSASLWDEVGVETPRRFWEFMAVSKNDSDETLLAIAREGEGVAMKVYQKALTDVSLIPAVRRVLEKQQTHIEMSGRLVGSFRVLKAA
jgi:hypothetical protein